MFGWTPRLAIDTFLATEPGNEGHPDPAGYVHKLQLRLQQAHKLAAEALAKQGARNKALYDRKAGASGLDVDDKVLVRQTHFDGNHKLADRWKPNTYTVLEIPNPEIPVYRVKREDGIGPVKTVHRNLLLPIQQVSSFPSVPIEVTPKQKIQIEKRLTRSKSKHVDSTDSDCSTDSETYIIPQRRAGYIPGYTATKQRSNSLDVNPNPPGLADTELQNSTSRTSTSFTSLNENVGSNQSEQLNTSSFIYQNQPTTQSTPPTTQSTPLTTQQHTVTTHPTTQQESVGRPKRLRQPPNRYGEWVTPIIYYV